MSVKTSRVAIVILNWNGWRDTTECLESVFRNNYPNYQVILCDNNSQDDSLIRIKAWAEGLMEIEVPERNPLRNLSFPPVSKPLTHKEYNASQAERGGSNEDNKVSLILIQTGANLGFAGGNNVGLRYVMARDDFDYVWLLNNDTVIEPDALTQLIRCIKERPDAGMCGSTIPFYHEPDKLWALGGATYNKLLAITRCIGLNQPTKQNIDRKKVEYRLKYLAGASILVSRQFLRDVGLLSEDYFLYFEELDWAVRAKGRFSMAYAPESIVYHKVSASTGKDGANKDSRVSEYFMLKNSLLFTYKYYPLFMPFVFARVTAIYLLKRIRSSIQRFFFTL